jgi:hypothetical protein
MHTTFMFKQCAWHQCSNNTSRWMTSVYNPYELTKKDFAWQLLPNFGHEVCDVRYNNLSYLKQH